LVDGKAKLLFKKYKILVESKEFNSATSIKNFSESNEYYFYKDAEIQRVRPSKKEFLVLFKDKEEQIKAYQKTEIIDYKSNKDLSALVSYYNSL